MVFFRPLKIGAGPHRTPRLPLDPGDSHGGFTRGATGATTAGSFGVGEQWKLCSLADHGGPDSSSHLEDHPI